MVEPATGRQYALADAPYDGVEAVWNARNFWACLQMPQPHSDARARPADLSCDLADTAAWEALWEEARFTLPAMNLNLQIHAGHACLANLALLFCGRCCMGALWGRQYVCSMHT